MADRMRVTSCITHQHNRSGTWQQLRKQVKILEKSLDLSVGGLCCRDCGRSRRPGCQISTGQYLSLETKLKCKVYALHSMSTVVYTRHLTRPLTGRMWSSGAALRSITSSELSVHS